MLLNAWFGEESGPVFEGLLWPGGRVMSSLFSEVDKKLSAAARTLDRPIGSLDRPIVMSLGRSVARSLNRSVVRSLGRSIVRSVARSVGRPSRSVARS